MHARARARSLRAHDARDAGVLTTHVEQAPDDFFQDPVSNKNFLMPMLSRLFDNVESAHALLLPTSADGAAPQRAAFQRLLRRVERFRAVAEKKFAAEFDADDDSDEIVVV